MKKKVLLVSAGVSNSGHGLVYLTNLYQKISASITVFVPDDAKINLENFTPTDIYKSNIKFSSISREHFKIYGLLSPIIRGLSRMRLSIKFHQDLLIHLKSNHYDVVHILDSDYIAYIYLQNKISKTAKTVYTLHASDFELRGASFATIYKSIIKYFLRDALNKTSHVICHGVWMKDRLLNSFPVLKNKILAIDYPSNSYSHFNKNEIRSSLNLPENKIIISFIGMIRKDKKIEIALEAFSMLNDNYHLIVAGSLADYNESEIIDLIDDNNIKDRTSIKLGYLDKSEYENYFKASDIFLSTHSDKFPSASGPVSDARTFGIPVVVPPGGQLEQYVNQYNVGEVAFKHDVDSFKIACEKIGVGKLKKHENVIEVSNKLSWDNFSKKHLNVYENL